MLMFSMMISCQEYESFENICTSIDEYILCSSKVSYDEAQYQCADYESVLVDTDTDADYVYPEKVKFVTALAELEFEGAPWWSGLDTGSGCQIQSVSGAWTPDDCSNEHFFICEI